MLALDSDPAVMRYIGLYGLPDEAAYRGGRIPLEDYLTLRERLIRIRRDLIDATGAVEEARARLVRATGLRRDLLIAALRAQNR